MNEQIIYSDRYGGNYPNPETICEGDCEGMGLVPVKKDDENELYRQKWIEAEVKNPNPPGDAYHFVSCNDCNGTGKK